MVVRTQNWLLKNREQPGAAVKCLSGRRFRIVSILTEKNSHSNICFHTFYTFFSKGLEHFWKVWYIITIQARIVSRIIAGYENYLQNLKGVISL